MNVREMNLGDYEGVMAVGARNGLSTQPKELWTSCWTRHPFAEAVERMPKGWVLETGGRIVGTLGNIPLAFEWNCEPVWAAVASAWAVDPEHRNFALKLAAQFFAQRNVDLLLDTTASAEAGRVLPLFKAARVPAPSYGRVLMWIVDPPRFAASFLRKRGVPLASVLGYPVGAAIAARNLARRKPRQSASLRRVQEFDERFDAFWQALRKQQNRLIAVRSRETLNWHFRVTRMQGKMEALALEDGGLAGYIVLLRKDAPHYGLRRFQVADLQVLHGRRDHVQQLLLGALELAKEQGVHMVEALGFDRTKREALEQLHPYHHDLPIWPYFYRAETAALRASLANPEAWDASPYDGDDTL